MKSIKLMLIIFTLLYSANTFAQLKTLPPTTSTSNKIKLFTNSKTLAGAQAEGVIIQPVMYIPNMTYTPKKVLNNTAWGDSISLFYPQGQYIIPRAFVRDTANTRIDSFYVEVLDTAATIESEKWVRIGAKNTLTGQWEEILVPGDGKKVLYDIPVFYTRTIRIRRINTAYTTRIKSYVNWEGRN